jgi:hypothetical protein
MRGHVDDTYESVDGGTWMLFKPNGDMWYRGAQKIEAVKAHREIWGSNLRDAKDYVEALVSGRLPEHCQIHHTSEAGLSVILDHRGLVRRVLELEARVQVLEMARGLHR